jgi:hypothetical protein
MYVELGHMKRQYVLMSNLMKVSVFISYLVLPFNDYFQYFGPDYRLEVPATNMENMNSQQYLDRTQTKILENLRNIIAPSVQMHSNIITLI